MLRIASVVTSQSSMLARHAPLPPSPQTPLVPPVTPAAVMAKLPPDPNTARSEAAFAVVLSRAIDGTGDNAQRYQPQFADPLPDLPAVDAPAAPAAAPAAPGNAAR